MITYMKPGKYEIYKHPPRWMVWHDVGNNLLYEYSSKDDMEFLVL